MTIQAGDQRALWMPQFRDGCHSITSVASARGVGGLSRLIVLSALVVLPPFFYVIKSSLTVALSGLRTAPGFENYQRVFELGSLQLWGATVAFALGSSALGVVLGFTAAWLLARTN